MPTGERKHRKNKFGLTFWQGRKKINALVQQSTAKLLYCKRDILKEIATAKADFKVKERHNYDDIIDKL